MKRTLMTMMLAFVTIGVACTDLGGEENTKRPPSKTVGQPPLQFVNSRAAVVEYEVSRVGGSGIGSADLWWTRNDGREWTKAPAPPHPDVKTQRAFRRVVDLQEGDGLYGFTIIVRSGAGLAKQSPRPGDVPQIRVELDTVPPEVQLFKPQPGPGAGLVITWKAKDKNLTESPITLEWRENAQDPWHIIEAGLANTGRHVWQLPPALPVKVYLRVRARDLAGNEGRAVTPEPLVLDFTVPDARVVAVVAAEKKN